MLKYLIGIDVGGTNIKVMIMDTGLTVIGKRSFPTSAEDGYDMISDRIITNIDCMLAEKNIDYAFFCCDGIYNMGLDEAAECAELVGAKHNIPYHVTAKEGVVFDRELAEQFEAPDRLIVEAGEEIVIE